MRSTVAFPVPVRSLMQLIIAVGDVERRSRARMCGKPADGVAVVEELCADCWSRRAIATSRLSPAKTANAERKSLRNRRIAGGLDLV